MKKASRIISAILICALMLLMTACGGKDSTPFTHGTWSGRTYTSTFLGIKVTPGSEWEISSDDVLAKSVGISDLSASNIKKTLDSGKYIYELALYKDNRASITIVVQDNDKAVVKITEKDYNKNGATVIEEQMKKLGVSCKVTPSTVTFLGKSTRCMEVTAHMSEGDAYEIQVPMFVGKYVASVNFAARTKAELYDAIGIISAL